MATFGPGSVVRRRRFRLGVAPWTLVAAVWRRLGAIWWLVEEADTEPGAASATLPFTFDRGWLTVPDAEGPRAGLGEARATALARHLAAAGGRSVLLRREEATFRARAGALGTTRAVVDVTVTPDGRTRAFEHDEAEDHLDKDGIDEATADWIAAELWGEIPLPPSPVPLPDRHPALARRDGHLRLPATLPLVVSGPSVVFGGAGWRRPLDPAARVALEDVLAQAGALDLASVAPDLERWRDRALRRAGLPDLPRPASPEHDRFSRLFDDLSRADRSAPGRDGRVAAHKLASPGAWLLDPAEIARIAAAPGSPEWARHRAAEPDWTVEVADDAAPTAPPWTLDG